MEAKSLFWERVSFISIDHLRMYVQLRTGETLAYTFADKDQLNDYLKSLTGLAVAGAAGFELTTF
ncbi:MAG TPA: hypothetical protein VK633_07965 [Verrucomicrobiae bacterium]|nr:hypothetical protein [Verrucomicrobiae bacterium]